MISERLTKGYYVTRKLFIADMRRMFSNYKQYNPKDSHLVNFAIALEKVYLIKMKELNLWD